MGQRWKNVCPTAFCHSGIGHCYYTQRLSSSYSVLELLKMSLVTPKWEFQGVISEYQMPILLGGGTMRCQSSCFPRDCSEPPSSGYLSASCRCSSTLLPISASSRDLPLLSFLLLAVWGQCSFWEVFPMGMSCSKHILCRSPKQQIFILQL